MKRLGVRKRLPPKPEPEEDEILMEDETTQPVGVIPAIANLMDSLERPLKRLGKHELAKKARKQARKLRASSDSINQLVSGVATIVQAIKS